MSIRRTINAVVASLLLCVAFGAAPRAAAQTRTNGRIAFERNVGGVPDIFAMNADGTGEVNLTNTPTAESQAAWSPDGSKIVFVRAPRAAGETPDLYVMDADGGNLKPLTNDAASERFPAWSPDGSRVAYARTEAEGGSEQIYAVNADGSGLKNLTASLRGDHTQPAWSPDSKRLAFASWGAGASSYDIWTMDADGSGAARLTDGGPAYSLAPAWSPDGRKIAFTRDYEIYFVEPASGAETNLTASENMQEEAPEWSPDGTRLVFSRSAEGNLDIYSMKADGTDQRRLTTDPLMDTQPAWQPARTQVVFVSGRDGNREIYLTGEDGNGPTRLTTNPAADTAPALSPDGRKVAFVSAREGGSMLYLMNADGTNVVRLTSPPEDFAPQDDAPAWSPDGSKLVFSSRSRDSKFQLYVVGADGSGLRKISDGAADDLSPSWSPDGSKIVFQSLRRGDQTYDIYSMKADGTNLVNLTHDEVDESDPAFSPDGTKIAYVRSCCSSAEIYVMNADGTNPTRLTSNTANDRDPAWSPDGARVVYASLRNAVTNVSTYDLYATAVEGGATTRLTTDGLENVQPSLSFRASAEAPAAHSIQITVLQRGEKLLAGVTLTLSGGASGTQTTDAGGFATFPNLPAGGTYTVNASKQGYTFKPASRTFGPLGEDTSGSFEASRANVTLGGRVSDASGSPLAGVGVALSGSATATTQTDASGNYSFNVEAGGGYTLTPALAHHAFAPASRTFAAPDADQTADFTATLQTHGFSGRVLDGEGRPLPGVTLALGGSAQATAVTNAEGFFSFEGLPGGGSYTLTPARAGYTFDPAVQTVSDLDSSLVINFHASPVAQPARVEFDAAVYTTGEGARLFNVTVKRTGDASAAGTVFYETLDGTATERGDYTTALGTLRFAAGETEKTFDVLLTDDAYAEGREALTLKLSDATGGLSLGERTTAALNVDDNDADDGEPGPNPSDEAESFVRQHYHDFLNREPDAEGLRFWADQLAACAGEARCLDHARQNVSAAFFLSIEFQQTGYLVHRLQRAAYGTLPRYRDLVRDAREMGRGVVVGRGAWREQLEANKRALVEEWAARPEFAAKYAGASNAQFVVSLWENVGLAPAAPERDELIAGLESGALTRADALRRVAESDRVTAKEFNSAFVLMEYFGYLRRNPDDAPDKDMSGYGFWLGKLDDNGGNFQRAEMVRSFLVSGEYRKRFGR